MTPEQVGGVSHAEASSLIETRKCWQSHPRMMQTLVCYASKLGSASDVSWDSRVAAPLVFMSVEEVLGFVLQHHKPLLTI